MSALDRLMNSKNSTAKANAHVINVSSPIGVYEITIKFKFSRIADKSGTGKSMLCSIMTNALANKFGYSLNSDLPVTVLSQNKDDVYKIVNGTDVSTIFIFDEECKWVFDNDFIHLLETDKNMYFVYISRNRLPNISYDYRAIYRIENLNGIRYNIPLFTDCILQLEGTYYDIECIVTEDSNSGMELFTALSKIDVDGAWDDKRLGCSKDNIKMYTSNCLCIVDGSAFGSCIEECLDEFNTSILYLINSVEWLLLKSGINKGIGDVLEEYNEYNYPGYSSYEKMCTDVLQLCTADYVKYNKRSINKIYLTDNSLIKIAKCLDERLVKFYVKDIFL